MTPSHAPVSRLDKSNALATRVTPIPRVADVGRARARFDDFLAGLGTADASVFQLFSGEKLQALLLAIADHSPFLWGLITSGSARLEHLLRSAPETRLDEALSEVTEACEAIPEQPAL